MVLLQQPWVVVLLDLVLQARVFALCGVVGCGWCILVNRYCACAHLLKTFTMGPGNAMMTVFYGIKVEEWLEAWCFDDNY